MLWANIDSMVLFFASIGIIEGWTKSFSISDGQKSKILESRAPGRSDIRYEKCRLIPSRAYFLGSILMDCNSFGMMSCGVQPQFSSRNPFSLLFSCSRKLHNFSAGFFEIVKSLGFS